MLFIEIANLLKNKEKSSNLGSFIHYISFEFTLSLSKDLLTLK